MPPSSRRPARTAAANIRRALRLVNGVVRRAVRDELRPGVGGPFPDGRPVGPVPLLTLGETAGVLGVSLRTVQRLVRRGEIGTVRAGSARRVHPAALDAYVRSKAR